MLKAPSICCSSIDETLFLPSLYHHLHGYGGGRTPIEFSIFFLIFFRFIIIFYFKTRGIFWEGHMADDVKFH